MNPATVISAEGARVGVVVCPICSAAILLDPRETFDAAERHQRWHEDGGPHAWTAGA